MLSKKISLRILLVLPFLLQIIGAVSLVGWLSWRSGQSSVNTVVQELNQDIGDRIIQRLDSQLDTSHTVNEVNANLIKLGVIDPFNRNQMEKFLIKQLQSFDNLGFVAFADSKGQYTEILRDSNQFFLKFRGITSGDRYTYKIDRDGNRLALVTTRKNYDPRKRPFYKQAIAAGKPTWTEIYQWFGSDNFSTDAVQPLYKSSSNQNIQPKELIGVLDAGSSLTNLSKFLQVLKIGNTGQAFIIERSGNLVATSTQEKIFAGDKEKRRFKITEVQNPTLRNVGIKLLAQFQDFKQIDKIQNLTLSFDTNSQNSHFVQVIPYQDPRGLDWLVVIAIPEADFIAQINDNAKITFWLCIITLMIAIAIGIITTELVAAPIHRLNQAAQKIAKGEIAKGEWQKDIASEQISELNQLSTSFKMMANQLQEAFSTLEQRVAERTSDLATANQQILELNDSLKSENLRMGAELEVSHRLQQMILPKPEELTKIAELDISGSMQSATEMGGDYYDVLRHNGQIKIGIGDVTGHGLESGVLMLMIQTAVRTLLNHDEKNPVKFLDTLNRTIHGNLERMGSDKSLSLSLLDYQPSSGRLSLSGQHEEVILVRKNGDTQRIDTLDLGFPIGLELDIVKFVAQLHIQLESGDTVVLYTDGVTEAENIKKEHYGLERLCEIVQKNSCSSADCIRQEIIASLRSHIGNHQIFDDITLVVLKQR
jgi:phosphoserine phosphatase RsbU/P